MLFSVFSLRGFCSFVGFCGFPRPVLPVSERECWDRCGGGGGGRVRAGDVVGSMGAELLRRSATDF